MKRIVPVALMCGVLGLFHATAQGQEHKHEQKQEQKEAPIKESMPMKCCEGMETNGEMKGDMKAKMEKMKAMKEKMAEKLKEMEGMKMKDTKSDNKTNEPGKDAHQH